MTITSTASKIVGRGNGATTSFAYNFLIPDASSLQVTYTDTAGAQTVLDPSRYTVSGLGSASGGTVTYPLTGSPIASGTALVIERVLPITQPTRLQDQAGYFPSVVESAFDRVTMLLQQIAGGARNYPLALTFPSVDVSPTTTLPPALSRAGKFFAFDSSGNPQLLPATTLSGDVSPYTAIGAGSSARTLAQRFTQVVSVKDFGAKGDGSTDDTAAINSAISACALGACVFFPSGAYKVTSTITIPSGVTLRGDGRNFGTIIRPSAGVAPVFAIDGSLYGGGFAFRILISDMVVDMTNVTAAASYLVYLNSAYNIEFRNVFLYNQPASITEMVYMKGCNNIVFDDVIMYGVSSGVTRAVLIDGTTQVSCKFINCDIESYNRGIVIQGTAIVDITDCYMERCIVCVDHQSTAGMTTIVGGYLSSVNGYCVNIAGPNLAIQGTFLNPFTGAVPSGPGINTDATFHANVAVDNVSLLAQTGFVDTTTNWLTVRADRPQIAGLNDRKVYTQKTLTSGVTTDLVKLANFDQYIGCKLRLQGFVGAAFYVNEYHFVISASSTASGLTTVKLVDTSNSNYAATISILLTPNGGAGYVMVQANVVTTGALGAGLTFAMQATLEVLGTETGVGGIYIQ